MLHHPDFLFIPYYHIIGVWRSGTTLLSAMLNAHPQLISLPENNLLLFLIKNKNRYINEKNKQKAIGKVVELLQSNYRTRYFWCVNFEKLHEYLMNSIIEINPLNIAKACVLHSIYGQIKNLNGIRFVIEKSPASTFFWKELLKWNPETKFIYIYRNPVFNTISRKRRYVHKLKWIYTLALWWKEFHKKALSLQKDHPDKVFFVKYEDLISKPEENLKKICEFLTIDFSPSMLNYHNYYRETSHLVMKNWANNPPPYFSLILKTYETVENVFSPIKEIQKNISNGEVEKIIFYICKDYAQDYEFPLEFYQYKPSTIQKFKILIAKAIVWLLIRINAYLN